ncbi:MAG: proton-conducting transporter membrane subunit [Phycisphaerae bacterium]
MLPLIVILGAAFLIAAGGIPGLVSKPGASWGQLSATALTCAGGILGAAACLGVLLFSHGSVPVFTLRAVYPNWPLHFRLDPLSAFFALPVFVMASAGAIYGHGYWNERRHPRTGRRLRFFYGLFVAGMVLVTVADDGLAFIIAWEIMALASFFLIATEDQHAACRQAAWVYFVATHLATLLLMALFALLHAATGSFLLVAVPAAAGWKIETAIFLTALAGFGLKAGIMPLHFWLPGAHAQAPSHISALLSGVLLKIGIYGLLRILTLLPHPPAFWGVMILGLGSINALLGVVYALGQHDIKRLLAYSSIENIGIILMGLGVAMIGVATDHPVWEVLGIAGCLLHVWNHALFKSLLFFSAGSVISAARTRQIDSLGGLARHMAWSSNLFLVGAMAICGLPPLNGFVSELLIYLGLFHPVAGKDSGVWASISADAVILAVVGSLAVACFVKVYGVVFLGSPRTEHAAKVHESPRSMMAPMLLLAGLCGLVGVFPLVVLVPLSHAAAAWMGRAHVQGMLSRAFPWGPLTVLNFSLVAVAVAVFTLVRILRRFVHVSRAPTWGCGYSAIGSRMQYTGTSFAGILVGLWSWVLRPLAHGKATIGLFPKPVEHETEIPPFITDRATQSLWHYIQLGARPIRRLQQGSVQQYLIYMLLAVVVLMALIPLSNLFVGGH